MTKDDLYMPHVNVEDCYYSCPASGECCDERYRDSKECNCWADKQRENVDAVWTELEQLRVIAREALLLAGTGGAHPALWKAIDAVGGDAKIREWPRHDLTKRGGD